jgi:hypothetical protein
MTLTFVNFLRNPDPEHPIGPESNCTKIYLRRTQWRGAQILPYVDNFLLFASTKEEALTLRYRLAKLLDRLGVLRHLTKGFWTPRKSDTTWVSTSTQHQDTSTRRRKN